MNYALILAGGIGSRFWPLSTELKPKQFLNICSDKPMFEETLHRIRSIFSKENIYIATNKIYAQDVKRYTKNLAIPAKNFFFEPEAKNTFAPIAFLSQKINLKDTKAVIVILPCDHMINEEHKFLSTLRKAIKVAHQGFIVTLGIKPKSPQTGYGYIKINLKFKIQNSKIKTQNSKIYRVERFIEKPSLSRARKFFKDRRFYWNSGIFIFRVDTLLEEIKKIMPDTYKIITKMQNSNLKDCIQLWHKLPATSIDYAIMEKTKKLALIPLDFAWLDLGSWEALAKVLKTDKNGNIFRGNCIDIGSKNSFVWSDKPYVATLGLDNIIVVDIKDSLLVCTKQKTQDIKKIVQIIAAKRARK